FTCKVVKKSALKKQATPGAKAAGDALILIDNEDDTATVSGADASGFPVPIDNVATLAVTSDTPTVVSVDQPNGMTFQMHALAPGSANLTVTATWNDPAAGIGPFTATLPVNVTTGPANRLVITPGTPVPR